MDKMEVFLIVVILNPTAKQKHDDGAVPQIVVQLTTVIAKDESGAAMKAFKLVPEEYAKFEDRLDVKVLPFRTVALHAARVSGLRKDWEQLARQRKPTEHAFLHTFRG